MTVKEYLYQTITLNRKINELAENVTRLEQVVMRTTPAVSDMPKSPGRNTRSNEIAQTALIDMKIELNSEIDKLIDLKEEIRELITRLDDSNQKLVLCLRYIDLRSWESIAEIMDRSVRSLHMIHGNALQNLEGKCEINN